jgi:hypothetical protein
MKNLLLFLAMVLFLNCATQYTFDPGKADMYLRTHQDRPVQIQKALSTGKLANGMNEEEVIICWGKPQRIETRSLMNREIKFWRYFETRTVGQAIGWSCDRFIKKKVLSKEVRFTNGVVGFWREFSS